MLEVTPEYTLERAKMENTLVSEFSTSYAKSPHNNENRVYNIKKGADMIDGVRLNPGEEFDTNDILGPRMRKMDGRRRLAYETGNMNRNLAEAYARYRLPCTMPC